MWVSERICRDAYTSAMPVLMMDVGKMGMVVPDRLVPMLMYMRPGSIPLLVMLVLMVLIVLMWV